MLKVLLKKQLSEVFRNYFFNSKKNTMRSRRAVAVWFVLYIALMAGMLGGMFTFLSLTLCGSLTQAGQGWLYFLLMSSIAVLLGAFGSVFNTYAGLYLAKDNDLLLSLPIPVRTIMAARLVNVYLMGTMYAATVLIPTLIVYWMTAGMTPARVICGLLVFLIVTMIVMLLSCLLGWVVAKLSVRLKNKSFISVLISLLFIGGYYFFYFRANNLVREMILHADVYGEKIKGAAYVLYLYGRAGEGDWLAALGFTAVIAILSALTWMLMQRSFLRIVTAGGNTRKAHYTEKAVRPRSVFGALLAKEFGRFTSSANYMLNCGLGILMIPAFGVFLLFKGREICEVIGTVFSGRPDSVVILLCAAFCMLSSMNNMAAPSVSLEGNHLWTMQSLPVSPGLVLRAKASVQLILTGIPMLAGVICAAAVVNTSPVEKILLCVLPFTFTAFSSFMNMMLGVRMPLLTWTNETVPIKQGGAVVIALFGGMGINIIFAGLYLLIGYKAGAAVYLLCWSILYAAAAFWLLRWLDTKGAALFAEL